jgi:CTP:phosphocholine cytidylyltransferase-like protein
MNKINNGFLAVFFHLPEKTCYRDEKEFISLLETAAGNKSYNLGGLFLSDDVKSQYRAIKKEMKDVIHFSHEKDFGFVIEVDSAAKALLSGIAINQLPIKQKKIKLLANLIVSRAQYVVDKTTHKPTKTKDTVRMLINDCEKGEADQATVIHFLRKYMDTL